VDEPVTWRWRLLRAGAMRLDGGGMFGVVPKVLWSRMAEPDEQNRIPLQTNCLLLEDGRRRVVVETGFGGKWSDKERGFYELQRRTVLDALGEIDVDPADVTDVIVTHLHFDHAGGLTRLRQDAAGPVPSFPNARVHVQKIEWDDALAGKSVMTATYLRSHLDPIADRVHAFDGAGEILPGIDVFPVPGHTWGQHAVRFEDGDGIVCFPGDVMPTANHVGLSFSMGYDVCPYENMLTKRALLERAAAEGWRLVLDHDPGEPIVRVRRDAERPGRFELVR
jgi:glyoxylase-like metal-dependent hydrolase (beta-lactamase superfamily II)